MSTAWSRGAAEVGLTLVCGAEVDDFEDASSVDHAKATCARRRWSTTPSCAGSAYACHAAQVVVVLAARIVNGAHGFLVS